MPAFHESQANPPRQEATVAGVLDRVVFHNPENGFCVLRIKAQGNQEATVVGHLATVKAGDSITATGEWVNDRLHGRQFKASLLRVVPPSSADGIEKYLASGVIKGIGKGTAKKLVATFGTKLLEVIDTEPERLREVPGLRRGRIKKILAAWGEQRAVRDIMVFLHSHGIGTARAVRIFKTYGVDAVRLITENPYRLASDIRGIGFKMADDIAMRLGVERTAMIRLRAGIGYALTHAMDDGHCGLPRNELAPLAERLLEVPAELVGAALDQELAAGKVIADTVGAATTNSAGAPGNAPEVGADATATVCIFLPGLHRAELTAAERLRAIAKGAPPWPRIDADKALPWVEQRTGLALADEQKEAVRQALATKVMVITGGPGVGKTTIVNSILRILNAKHMAITLCAPTGRAARRMSETTGMEARTIHRLLEMDPIEGGFRRRGDNQLECDLLVVDETSMVDVPLMKALMQAIPNRSALLMVGDVDQLPSVGPGQVLADIIASGVVPVVRLTKVFRQAAQSRIIVNAHQVNEGRMPDLKKPEEESDFYFVRADEPGIAASLIVELVKTRIPQRFGFDPIRDIQVLCPMNRGPAGTHSLNVDLQAALNPTGERKVERFGATYGPGDKVMQIVNDYDKEVYNGDIGYVADVDPEGLTAVFDGRAIKYRLSELDTLVPAYATTIHKSQGSEYPAVVIPLMMQHYPMLQRNLVYTGITRGKKLVVLVGQAKALAQAIRSAGARHRWSKLRDWLVAGEAAR
jgi:exodeoxyribonuclease V alpha subunit